jgi:hypothetical protein
VLVSRVDLDGRRIEFRLVPSVVRSVRKQSQTGTGRDEAEWETPLNDPLLDEDAEWPGPGDTAWPDTLGSDAASSSSARSKSLKAGKPMKTARTMKAGKTEKSSRSSTPAKSQKASKTTKAGKAGKASKAAVKAAPKLGQGRAARKRRRSD